LRLFPSGVERAGPLRHGEDAVGPADAKLRARSLPREGDPDGAPQQPSALEQGGDDALDALAVRGER
jgi:hypothetical protein